MRHVLIYFFLFTAVANAALPTDNQAIRTILGEAGNQGYRGMLGVADVIRNRGSIDGCYGLTNPIVDKQPAWAWKMAREAWAQSATNDITGGAKYFENVKAFGMPKWAKNKVITVVIKDHTFFK